MLTWLSFYILRNIDHRSICVVIIGLFVNNFLEHMQLVLSSCSSWVLLFLHELVLWLLTNNNRLIYFLLLSGVSFFCLLNKIILHHRPSNIQIWNFERFLTGFCFVILWSELVILHVTFNRTCIYLLNYHGVFHSLKLWSKIFWTFVNFHSITTI